MGTTGAYKFHPQLSTIPKCPSNYNSISCNDPWPVDRIFAQVSKHSNLTGKTPPKHVSQQSNFHGWTLRIGQWSWFNKIRILNGSLQWEYPPRGFEKPSLSWISECRRGWWCYHCSLRPRFVFTSALGSPCRLTLLPLHSELGKIFINNIISKLLSTLLVSFWSSDFDLYSCTPSSKIPATIYSPKSHVSPIHERYHDEPSTLLIGGLAYIYPTSSIERFFTHFFDTPGICFNNSVLTGIY